MLCLKRKVPKKGRIYLRLNFRSRRSKAYRIRRWLHLGVAPIKEVGIGSGAQFFSSVALLQAINQVLMFLGKFNFLRLQRVFTHQSLLRLALFFIIMKLQLQVVGMFLQSRLKGNNQLEAI